jgi:L-lactate dehydrogenase
MHFLAFSYKHVFADGHGKNRRWLMTTESGAARANRRPPKVSIIGAGMVGATLAYTLIVERLAGEVVLVDINLERAAGEAMDIHHALPFSAPTRVLAGDYGDCSRSDIIVITAGAAQKAGESRLTLVKRNVDIFRQIVPRLVEVAEDAIVLIVSNPVDVLTYATIRFSGLSWRRVIGSGTILDTARFRYELSARCGVDPRNVHAYILGEHGDSEVPVWSRTNIGGVELERFCEGCDHHCSRDDLDALFDRVKNAAYEIIARKGATYYAIALGTARMIEAVLRDQSTVLTASVLLHGEYGIEDVCLSLPVVLGREGVERVVPMPLTPEERKALLRSADVLRAARSGVGLESS